MSTEAAERERLELEALFRRAGELLLACPERAGFVERLRPEALALAPDLFAGTQDGALRDRLARGVAFRIWRLLPNPTCGWRPPPRAEPGRNDPCACGSGEKYKRCCQRFGDDARIFADLDPLFFVLLAAPLEVLSSLPRERLDPFSLAQVALAFTQDGDPGRAIALLQPWLEAPTARLDGRHAPALEELVLALRDVGETEAAEALVDRFIDDDDLDLWLTASRLHVSSLVAARELDRAARLLRECLERLPHEPVLGRLEIGLLVAENRLADAAERASTWAADMRAMGPDYAEEAAFFGWIAADPARIDGDEDEPVPLADWRALVDRLCASGMAAAVGYECVRHGESIALEPTPERVDVETRWQNGWLLDKAPDAGRLDADASVLIEDLAGVVAFLDHEPLAGSSFEVLEDVALALGQIGADAHWQADQWRRCELRLAQAGRELLDRCLPEALRSTAVDEAFAPRSSPSEALAPGEPPRLAWGFDTNRAALGLVSIEILARLRLDEADPMVDRLLDWALFLNPADNLELRPLRIERLLLAGDAQRAQSLIPADDDPVMCAQAVLAAFMRGDSEQAIALLDRQQVPLAPIRAALLAPAFECPPAPDSHEVASSLEEAERHAAWSYRMRMRPVWRSTGALERLADRAG